MDCDCPDVTSKFNLGYIITNILYYNKDSLFYSYVIQIILVAYGYTRFGKGKYWKTLIIASCTGLLGAILEKVCVVWKDHPDNANDTKIYILLLLNEPCWIITEFAIPYLNMIKLKAFLSKEKRNILKAFTGISFVLFSIFRFRIGYLRYSLHTVFNDEIFHAHGYAFSTMAITEFVCSVFIIKKITRDYNRAKEINGDGNIYGYSRKSSLTILLLIDIIGFILAILSMFSNSTLEKVLKPFHCLKSNSLLILAFDSLIFKLNAKINGSSTNITSNGNNSYSNGNLNYKSEILNKNRFKKDLEKADFSRDHKLSAIPNHAYLPYTNSSNSLTSIHMTTFSNNDNFSHSNSEDSLSNLNKPYFAR
ncbi:hypothetical protein BCR32DRAFT_297125 [Anaeromyces robustus]|uniref:Integral membrane protein n=1 Tax=Anaeromyces robustus TaxID=1754192 RepID=A0A1Y1WNW3_9FUNG|nr:hypothetical protein BCR32DRAFT_297125 [Anaeromyces robustus]|eukprot:ORX75075.1 hypothetical protein BCR32DRAFT_297125 [Anaeromyces robustus]